MEDQEIDYRKKPRPNRKRNWPYKPNKPPKFRRFTDEERQAMSDRAKSLVAERGYYLRRKGQPDGVTLKQMDALVERAQERATKAVEIMKMTKIWVPDNDAAEKAMKAAIEVVETPGEVRARLQAAKLVLEFSQKKPLAASEVTINKAESFLEALLQANDAEGA